MTPAAGEPGGKGPDPAPLAAGRVGRPHGLDGSFYLTRPRPRLISLGAQVKVGERTMEIVRLAGTQQKPIVRLEGLSSREDAEALRGAELTVEHRDAPKLGEGEWWAHELEGCEVVDGDRVLGRVLRMIELPSCEALEVEPTGGGPTVLVPMVRAAVRRVAASERRIEVDLEFIGIAAPETPGDGPERRE